MNGRSPNGNFIGTGWAFPPAFTAGGADVVLVQDDQDIFESLQILLATSLGERVMREDYGCNLRDYLFEELDQRLLNNLRLAVTNAVRMHETRVEMEDVSFDIQADLQQSTIYIRIGFRVRTTNTRYNMVYPFYLTESALGPVGARDRAPALPPQISPQLTVQTTNETADTPTTENTHFVAFRHRADAANTDDWSGNYTRLYHPRLNGNPDAIIFVNSIWAFDAAHLGAGTSNPNSVEVCYRDGHWYICYRNPELKIDNGDPSYLGHAFNVLIAPEGSPNAFVYTGEPKDTETNMNRMYIDHPASNGKPDAYLMVTPRKSVASNHEIGVGYESARAQWFIYNQVNPAAEANAVWLPEHYFAQGSAFNVLVLPEGRLGNLEAFSHLATTENKRNQGTFFTHSDLDGDPNVNFFITQAWRQDKGGLYNDSPLVLWYDAPGEGDNYQWEDGYWFVYNIKGHTPANAVFNVFVLKKI